MMLLTADELAELTGYQPAPFSTAVSTIVRSCMIDGQARAAREVFDVTPLQAHAAVASGRSELCDPGDAREMHAAMDKANTELHDRNERASRAARLATLPLRRAS